MIESAEKRLRISADKAIAAAARAAKGYDEGSAKSAADPKEVLRCMLEMMVAPRSYSWGYSD